MIWIDYAILVVIMVSALLGMIRGLVQETFSLISWIAALWVAIDFHWVLAPLLDGVLSHPGLRTGIAFACLFLLTLMVGKMVGYLLASLINQSPLSALNRLGGGLFGSARGLLLVLALILVAQGLNMASEPWWGESRLLPSLEVWARMLGQLDLESYLHLVYAP